MFVKVKLPLQGTILTLTIFIHDHAAPEEGSKGANLINVIFVKYDDELRLLQPSRLRVQSECALPPLLSSSHSAPYVRFFWSKHFIELEHLCPINANQYCSMLWPLVIWYGAYAPTTPLNPVGAATAKYLGFDPPDRMRHATKQLLI